MDFPTLHLLGAAPDNEFQKVLFGSIFFIIWAIFAGINWWVKEKQKQRQRQMPVPPAPESAPPPVPLPPGPSPSRPPQRMPPGPLPSPSRAPQRMAPAPRRMPPPVPKNPMMNRPRPQGPPTVRRPAPPRVPGTSGASRNPPMVSVPRPRRSPVEALARMTEPSSTTASSAAAAAPAGIARRPDIYSTQLGAAETGGKRDHLGADAAALNRWLRPATLRQQFLLTEILQAPVALRRDHLES